MGPWVCEARLRSTPQLPVQTLEHMGEAACDRDALLAGS